MAIRKALKVLVVLVAFAFVTFIALIIGLVIYLSPPAPKPLAVLDLQAPNASAQLELEAGSAIAFRSHVKLAHSLGDTKAGRRKVSSDLGASTLELRVVGPDERETVQTCKVSSSHGNLVSIGGDFRVTDMHTTCTFEARTTGKHVLRASVKWHELSPKEATLHIVRRADDD